jgi:RNA polymerase sigma-70 factor (ECF subfamily)
MRSDAELLRAARSDPAAFRELYERHAVQIHRFHLRRMRDADAAHD